MKTNSNNTESEIHLKELENNTVIPNFVPKYTKKRVFTPIIKVVIFTILFFTAIVIVWWISFLLIDYVIEITGFNNFLVM